jgi:serine protease Do
VTGKDQSPIELVENWAGWRYEQGYQVLTNLPWRFKVTAAINGGNSGGPSFNAAGEVIGLNHAGRGVDFAFYAQNDNYTIPINFAKNFAYQILNTGKYELPWMGIDILIPPGIAKGGAVSEFLEKKYDPQVARVVGVRHDSPAERAGIKQGDIITQFDGQTFATNTELRIYVFRLPIGKQVPVVVKRGLRKLELMVEIVPKRGYDSEFSY